MSQRFLGITMLTQCNGVCCHTSVCMVRSSYHNCIDRIPHLIEHNPPIFKTLCFRIILKCLIRIPPIHITQSDNILRAHVLQIAASHSTNTDASDIQFIARSYMPKTFSQYRTRNNCQPRRHSRTNLQKSSS